MKKLSLRNLLTLILISISFFCGAQIETMEGISPGGKKSNHKIDVSQFTENKEGIVEISPSIILLSTSTVSVPEYFHDAFYELADVQDKIYQYRFLHDRCEGTLYSSKTQSTERQMFVFRKAVGVYNYMPTVLEKNLQHKLQTYFASSTCYAYEPKSDNELSLKKIADLFQAQWVINPAVLQADTIDGFVRTQLQLEIWDSRVDSLIKKMVLISKAPGFKESLAGLEVEAENFIMSNLLRDKSFRKIARTNAKRAAAFEEFLLAQPKDEMVTRLLIDEKLNANSLGNIISPERDRFLTFTLDRYTPNFADKIPNKMYSNPYPNLDVSKDMDPNRAHFRSKTILGIQINGKWRFEPIQEDYIYTDDESKAKKVYYAACANLGLFKHSTNEIHDNIWEHGMLTPVDTATMKSIYDIDRAKDKDVLIAVDKVNHSYFQGIPAFLVRELIREYKYDIALKWERKVKDDHLKFLVKDRAVRKNMNVHMISTIPRRLQLFHDYEITRAVIPVLVKELSWQETLRFLYWEQDKPDVLYEWTYIPKLEIDPESKTSFGAKVNEQMNHVLPFNYFLMALDDDFWNNYVVAKDADGEYKYLVKISKSLE